MSDKACDGRGTNRTPARRPYEKPVVEFVELHGDQVLSGSCKTGVGTPTAASGTCEQSPCSVSGSS
jgi:hypothetical protein